MHTCWDVLEIEPTTNKKTIKIAYTSLVKQYNPETQSEKFQILRKAYEQALEHCYIDEVHNGNSGQTIDTEAIQKDPSLDPESGQGQTEQPSSTTLPPDSEPSNIASTTVKIEEQHTPSPQTPAQNTQQADLIFCDKVNTVWEDEARRYDEDEWKTLLRSEELLDLETKEKLWLKMFGFLAFEAEPKLIYSHPTLLIFITRSFDNLFLWSEDELRLQQYFDEDSIQKVLYLIDSRRFSTSDAQVSTNPAFEAPPIQIKWVIIFIIALLLLTNVFENALKDNSSVKLGNLLPNNEKLFTTEKKLASSNQRADTYFANSQWREAILHYSMVLDITPDSASSLFKRGTAHYQLKQFIEAESDFVRLSKLTVSPEAQALTLKMLGTTRLQLGKSEKAIEDLSSSIKLSPQLNDTHGTRAQIYSKQKKYTDALHDLDIEIARNPSIHWLRLRAWNYDQVGQQDKMCDDLSHACKLKDQDTCKEYSNYCIS